MEVFAGMGEKDPIESKELAERNDAVLINELAYKQGLDLMSDQRDRLRTVRQRATVLIALSGLAATFLGRAALAASNSPRQPTCGEIPALLCAENPTRFCVDVPTIAIGGALLCMLLTVIICLWMFSTKQWYFAMHPVGIINQFTYGKASRSYEVTLAVLAVKIEENYDSNKSKLKRMFFALNFAIVAVFLQYLFWLLAVAFTGGLFHG